MRAARWIVLIAVLAAAPFVLRGARADAAQQETLPAGANEAVARLDASPRHGEWVTISVPNGDNLRAWVVYPERDGPAPVVVVIHEIYGLTHWVRAVADQLAAEGFIAVAPDLLTLKNVPTDSTGDPSRQEATAAIRTLDRPTVNQYLSAAANWGMSQPSAVARYGVVGFCWGGTSSFAHAVDAPGLGAAVVYYGTSPEVSLLGAVQAPVLGLYAGDDERVNATVPPADSALKSLGKSFEAHFFEGAGHGFLRQQDGREGANMEATRQAWPRTVAFFREHLDS